MQPSDGTNDLVNVTDSSGETQAISNADPEIFETILKYIREGVTWQDLFGFMNGSAGVDGQQVPQTLATPTASSNQSDSSENESSSSSTDGSSSSSNSESSTSGNSSEQHDDLSESSNRPESRRRNENESRRKEDRVKPWTGDISKNSGRSSGSDDSDSSEVETESESHSNRRRRGRRTEPWTGKQYSGRSHDDSDDDVTAPVTSGSNSRDEKRDRVSSMRRGVWSGSSSQNPIEDNPARVMGMSSAQQQLGADTKERIASAVGGMSQEGDNFQTPIASSENMSNERSVGVGSIISNSEVEHNTQNLPGVGRLFNMSDNDVRQVINEFRQTGVMPAGTPQELADSIATIDSINPANPNTPPHPERGALGTLLEPSDPTDGGGIMGINPPNLNTPPNPERGELGALLPVGDPNDGSRMGINPPNLNAPHNPDRGSLSSDLGTFGPNEPRLINDLPIPSEIAGMKDQLSGAIEPTVIQEPRPEMSHHSFMDRPVPTSDIGSMRDKLTGAGAPTVIQEPRMVAPNGAVLGQPMPSDEEYISLPTPVDRNISRTDISGVKQGFAQALGASSSQMPLAQSPANGALNQLVSTMTSDTAITQTAATVPTGVEPALSSRIPSMIPASSVAPPGFRQ